MTQLTETENRVVEYFIKEQEKLKDIPDPHKSKLLFSEDVRKDCRISLDIKISQFNVIFSSLKKKNILVKQEDGSYKFPKLISVIGEDTTSIKYEFSTQ